MSLDKVFDMVKSNTTNYPTITNTALSLTARKPASVCAIQPTRCLSRVGGNGI